MADNYEIEVTLEETFGTGIRSVEQTGSSSASGGLNEITVTLTNDQQNKFYIMNGLKGEDGKDGRDGSSPIAVTTAEQMTDRSQIYLYGGNEEGYTARHLYYWNGSEWADYGLYGMPDTYLSTASIENETDLDEHGNTVSTSTTLGITGRILSNPAYYEFVQKLYSVSGENEDGALTQKATSEAIDAAQFLPILNHPIAPVGDNYLSASLVPNVLNVLNGVGYTFTEVNLTLSGAKENTLTRWFVRFTTGGNAVTDFDFPGTVTVPSGFSLKTQTTYDIVIENGVAHIWEDGNAVGNVLDAEATADAVADWLDDHPEATTTVADGSITTAKLASGVIDNTLLVSGAAADSAKVGQELSDLKSQINAIIAGGMGLKDTVKQALLAMFNVCMTNSSDSDDLYSQLYHALYDKEVLSISAVFNQGANVIYDTDSLDDLKQYLTVTANYDDGTSGAVTVYTLSGELTQGTSTITVTYQEKTTTFTVTVTHQIVGWYYPFNDSLLSDGTEDFGFTGVANYSTGVNGKAYYHQVGTEGDASTDPNGIYATGLTKVPSLASDFTISFWYKGVNQEVAQRMFFATKQTDPVVPSSSVTNVATEEGFNNLATGWSLNTSTTVGSRYCGSRIYWYKGTSQYYLRPELFIESNKRWGIGLVPPSGINLAEWHHYALTRKNGVLRMFFDGTKLFDYNISQAFIFPDQVAIGCGFGDDTSNISLAAGNGYSGMVDDLFFAEYCKWEEAFDPSEITY